MTDDRLARKLVTELRRKFGAEAVTLMSESGSEIGRWYPTGLPPLDLALGGKAGSGFPGGRLVELYGHESVGKTTLGALAMRRVQEVGGTAVMIDTESTLTKARAAAIGVDLSTLVYDREREIEEIFGHLELILGAAHGAPLVVFWDTIAASTTRAARGSSVGESKIAAHALVMSDGLRRICGLLAESGALVLACNQLKTSVSVGPYASASEKEATLGGKATKFHAARRVRLERTTTYKRTVAGKAVLGGCEITAVLTKNKDGPDGVRVILVMDGGRFLASASCLRTLQVWGAIPKADKGRFKYAGKSWTAPSWIVAYDAGKSVRDGALALLAATYEALYGKGE